MTQEQQDLLNTYREAIKVQKNYIAKLEQVIENQKLGYKEIIFDSRIKYEKLINEVQKDYEKVIDDLARKNEDLQRLVFIQN